MWTLGWQRIMGRRSATRITDEETNLIGKDKVDAIEESIASLTRPQKDKIRINISNIPELNLVEKLSVWCGTKHPRGYRKLCCINHAFIYYKINDGKVCITIRYSKHHVIDDTSLSLIKLLAQHVVSILICSEKLHANIKKAPSCSDETKKEQCLIDFS